MYDQKTKLLVRRLCGAALAVNALSLTALAQQAGGAAPASDEPVQMEKIVVTGSLIPTAETVGPAPVDSIGASTIERTSSQDVLNLLQKLTPDFQGSGNYGQTVNNGGNGEAYVALRNLTTLVLLDGRRMANSAFSSGSAVDLNTIPLSMIERVDVLKDSASATYGADAIGGVVNIITKKNYNGAEIGGRYGFAFGEGHTTEYRVNVVAGASTEKTSIVGGAQYYYMDPLLTSDREVGSAGIAEMEAKGLYAPSYISPTFPGFIGSSGRSYVLAGSPYAVGHPGYNPAITKPVVDGNAYTTMTAYLAAHPGIYLPLDETPMGAALDAAGQTTTYYYPLIDTTAFGTHSIQEQERFNAFANGSHQLFDKKMELFGSFLFANNHSQAVMAPVPVSSLGLYNIFVPGNSAVNPFGINLGSGGSSAPRVRTRTVDSGNRVFDSQTDYYKIVAGLKGEFDNGMFYEGAYNYNRSEQTEFTRGAINGATLNKSMLPNNDPTLAAAGISQLFYNGAYVPLYDVFALPGVNDPNTIDALRTTLYNVGTSELWSGDFRLGGTPVDLPAGKLGFAVGGQFYSESLSTDKDGLTVAGLAPGLNQSNPFPGGTRDSWGFYGEFRIPIFSPEFNLPALHTFDVTVGVRHEQLDPGGDATVPKVGFRWMPLDEQFLVRGSYSQGFIAPTVFNLFGAAQGSVPDIVVQGVSAQEQVNLVSNPNLTAAHSDSYTGGFVFTPKFVEGLTVSVDYYNIKTRNDVYRLDATAMVDDLNTYGSASQYAQYYRFDDGSALTTTAPNQVDHASWGILSQPLANGAKQETDGFDVSVVYKLDTESAGTFTFLANANILLNYTVYDPVVGGPYHYEGEYTDGGAANAQGTLPDFVFTGALNWDYKGFSYTVNAKYIPAMDDRGDMHPSLGSTSNNFTMSGEVWDIPAYFTVDMQLAYEFGKDSDDKRWFDGTRLAVGVNNITDEEPPFIASAFEDNTDKSTYDILGRFIYFEASKKF